MFFNAQYSFFRAYLVYWLLAIVGAMAVIPYAMHLNPQGSPPNILLALGINTILYGVLVYLGLKLAKDRFQIYLLSWPMDFSINKFLKISLFSGLLAGGLILGLESLIFAKLVNPAMYQVHTDIPKWQGLLASLYGGINEEILLRLFTLSLLFWILNKIIKNNNLAMILGILVSTLMFSAGHLPALYQVVSSPEWLDITRIIVINSVAGITFALLYWKVSLESAILAHFIADLVLHVFH